MKNAPKKIIEKKNSWVLIGNDNFVKLTDDIEYIRIDLYKEAQAEIAELNMRLTAVRNGYDSLLADCEGR